MTEFTCEAPYFIGKAPCPSCARVGSCQAQIPAQPADHRTTNAPEEGQP